MQKERNVMNRKQRVVLLIELALLAVMFVFPPYAGIDRESEGRIHAPLGYYPFWSPPTSQDVFHALRERFPSLEVPDADGRTADEHRLASFEPIFNKVHLIFNVALSMLATGLLFLVFRNRAKN
jgi:hypothetical protein